MWSNRLLSTLQNTSFWCRNCSVEFDPELESVRRESKLLIPDRNQETLVSTTPGLDYLNKSVEINHMPEIKGAFKSLQQKGIRIKEYHTTEKE